MHNEEVNAFFGSIIAVLIFFHVRVPLRAQKLSKLYINLYRTHSWINISNIWVLWGWSTHCKFNRANALRLTKIYTKSAAVSGSEKGRICPLKECTIRFVNWKECLLRRSSNILSRTLKSREYVRVFIPMHAEMRN